jgi:cyclopropane fatty-acyl-phospholipid synthase-like methyltransferase
MTYFDSDENVEEYIKMSAGYDGRALVDALRRILKPGATVLELGMGPGKDLNRLREHFRVTGSDLSQAFLDRYRQEHPKADLMRLDAVTMDTERRFDGIYSNKVLQHLTRSQLKTSFQRQARVLTHPGILLHSFWYGDKIEKFSGMRFVYYTEDTLRDVIGDEYEIIEFERYTEMEEDDSFYIVLRKRP